MPSACSYDFLWYEPLRSHTSAVAKLTAPGEEDWERLAQKWGVTVVGPPLEVE